MKICFFGPSTSAHMVKWCKWFATRGHEVHVVSFSHAPIEGVNMHHIDTGADIRGADFQKIRYFFGVNQAKKTIADIDPDIINVHYASSYGTVAALLGLKKYVLSMWGSDIFSLPRKSIIHKKLLQFSLNHAPHLFSTSKAMAQEARKYVDKKIVITPFGVDLKMFSPQKRVKNEGTFVIGTVKAVDKKYGIDYLLQAVALVKEERPDIPVQLRIAGKGDKKEEIELMNLCADLGIESIVKWLGFISQEEAAVEWANFDVAVVYSTVQESFGVSAVEAQASGVPLIISDSLGLLEATDVGESSVSLPKENAKLLAETLIKLYDSPSVREKMGIKGRLFVEDNYELNDCFLKIESFFNDIVDDNQCN